MIRGLGKPQPDIITYYPRTKYIVPQVDNGNMHLPIVQRASFRVLSFAIIRPP
jgi:hypothetical protein